MTPEEFLYAEKLNREIVKVSLIYVDMAEDLVSGLLLSQIVYWFLPDKNDKSKLRVQKEGKMWIAKRRTDWWNEIRISPKQFDKAIRKLESKGYIIKQRFKFNGEPTIHIRINWSTFLLKYQHQITQKGSANLPKGEVPIYPLAKFQ